MIKVDMFNRVERDVFYKVVDNTNYSNVMFLVIRTLIPQPNSVKNMIIDEAKNEILR